MLAMAKEKVIKLVAGGILDGQPPGVTVELHCTESGEVEDLVWEASRRGLLSVEGE